MDSRPKDKDIVSYLYLKAFHIFFVVSWFAGLFYLPRLYVNLALAEQDFRAAGDLAVLRALRDYREMLQPLTLPPHSA
jgi:putative membrane protein